MVAFAHWFFQAIRRRALPFTGVHVVHWDAHPDLSFSSSVDASLVFKPEQLYDALDDSPSGIAEFLLPLVFAGHVDRVTWVKPPWATQMQAQATMKDIAIGRLNDAGRCSLVCIRSYGGRLTTQVYGPLLDRLVVSCPWPHFIDDDLYAPETAMDPTTIKYAWKFGVILILVVLRSHFWFPLCSCRRWNLVVTEDPLATVSTVSAPWVLDIDLDYFSTWNPFRRDLEVLCSPAQVDLLSRVFTRPRYRSLTSQLSALARSQERQQFLRIMDRIQRLQPSQLESDATELVESLLQFYDEDQGDTPDTKTSLLAFLDLLAASEEATCTSIWHAAPCLDLPHHESSEAVLETLLLDFQAFLEASKSLNPPALVTIASSVSDRFLPPHQLALVKSRVLAMLEQVLGPLQVDEIEYEDNSHL
jgi:hypothetical protein